MPDRTTVADEKPKATSRGDKVLCPSSRCAEGHILFGVVQADGTIGFLANSMSVNHEFVAIAKGGRAPERRFRFASACVKSACTQWKDSRCGVVDEVLKSVPAELYATDLPDCSIREACRWFQQQGIEACFACPLVITDLMVEEEPISGS